MLSLTPESDSDVALERRDFGPLDTGGVGGRLGITAPDSETGAQTTSASRRHESVLRCGCTVHCAA